MTASLFLLLLFCAVLPVCFGNADVNSSSHGGGMSYSPFFIDDGEGHTVAGDPLDGGEMAEISLELLQLFGLTQRPQPAHPAVAGSASQFLLDVYRQMADPSTGMVLSADDDVERDGIKTDPPRSSSSAANIDAFNMSSTDRRVISHSDIIVSFINRGHPLLHQLDFPSNQLLWFDVTEMPRGQQQLTSVLRLHQHHSSSLRALSPSVQLTLSVHLIMRGENGSFSLRSLDRVVLNVDNTGWLSFNVTTASDLWTVLPGYNLGLLVQVVDENDKAWSLEDAGVSGSNGEDSLQPFMAAFLRQWPIDGAESGAGLNLNVDATKLRSKRSASTARRRKQRRASSSSSKKSTHPLIKLSPKIYALCQRHNLYVSFKTLGWDDWIIAPEGYAAFYCTGVCEFPLNSFMNATNHAVVQTLSHLLFPFKYPQPLCAPIKLTGVSVLYFDDNSDVILKKYHNMVATRCGCL